MNRLEALFGALRARGERALVCYVVAGDPSLECVPDLLRAVEDGGADVVELGLPFSDPVADGPSIQAAAQRALERGASVAGALKQLHRARERVALPVVLMTYLNPVLRYGAERFARDATAAGADGVIVTDLPPDEAAAWKAAARAAGLCTVFLVAPTSTQPRLELVARLASGFVYCVSRTGVTGAREEVPADLPDTVSRVRAVTSTPVCVGFGISTRDQVRAVTAIADGAVVGSALVDRVAASRPRPGWLSEVRDFVADLKEGARVTRNR
ncbi:MAG TPA: tryptophan synthase subunit alpha [Chthonomonadales bacterium]|nr:tryptophan synthase subunit alpha [Chthonomonadales bacterium]